MDALTEQNMSFLDDDTALTEAEKFLLEEEALTPEELQKHHPVFKYINKTWPELAFNRKDLFVRGTPKSPLKGDAANPLIPHIEGNPYYIYISDKEDISKIWKLYNDAREELIKKDGFKEKDLLDIEVRYIPRDAKGNLTIGHYEHGILHIPHAGISPGLERFKGIIFNWDTAFIIRGLIEDGKADPAIDLLNNMLYEIDHYGAVLNANATMYLGKQTSQPRSQLPLTAAKVLIMYRNWDQISEKKRQEIGIDKNEWLKNAVKMLEKYHNHWVTGARFDKKTDLSKFDSEDDTPCVEVLHAEPQHYERAYNNLCEIFERAKAANSIPLEDKTPEQREDLYHTVKFVTLSKEGRELTFEEKEQLLVEEKDFTGIAPVPFYLDAKSETVKGLEPAYFRGDRAGRENGLDLTERFGPVASIAITDYLPVCLNSFRAKMENEIADIYEILGKKYPTENWCAQKKKWRHKAKRTGTAIKEHNWDEGQPHSGYDLKNPENPMPPCFRDRNIDPLAKKLNIRELRPYNFASAFMSLWAGIVDRTQARQIIKNIFPLLETPFGVETSTNASGYQWDKNFIWAPFQVMAIEALERYDHYYTALKLALRYKRTLEMEFERTGALWEKNESITGTSNTKHLIKEGMGYSHNDRGFGWTNTAYIECLQAIERLKRKIAREDLKAPSITTNFAVKHSGHARPPADGPIMSMEQLDELVKNDRFIYSKGVGYNPANENEVFDIPQPITA